MTCTNVFDKHTLVNLQEKVAGDSERECRGRLRERKSEEAEEGCRRRVRGTGECRTKWHKVWFV